MQVAFRVVGVAITGGCQCFTHQTYSFIPNKHILCESVFGRNSIHPGSDIIGDAYDTMTSGTIFFTLHEQITLLNDTLISNHNP